MPFMRHLLVASCLLPLMHASAFAADSLFYKSERDTYHQSRRAPLQQNSGQYNAAKRPAQSASQRQIDTRSKRARTAELPSEDHDFIFGLKGGYRASKLKWNIASDPTGTMTPNILSELTWTDVGGIQAQPHISYTQKRGDLKGLHLEANVYKSVTVSGKNQDSDYFGDNRTQEFSRSNNSADSGHAEGFSAGIGYAFDFTGDRQQTLARFTALVGYSLQNQTYVMRDGNQTVESIFTPPLGPFPGLNSRYEAMFSAPFAGGELTVYPAEGHRLKFHGRYFKGSYTGEANWNLRADFAHPLSFEHDADADGWLLGAEYGWMFDKRVEVTLSADFDRFRADPGRDIVYFSDGTSATTRLNRVDWSNQLYMAGLNYWF